MNELIKEIKNRIDIISNQKLSNGTNYVVNKSNVDSFNNVIKDIAKKLKRLIKQFLIF